MTVSKIIKLEKRIKALEEKVAEFENYELPVMKRPKRIKIVKKKLEKDPPRSLFTPRLLSTIPKPEHIRSPYKHSKYHKLARKLDAIIDNFLDNLSKKKQ